MLEATFLIRDPDRYLIGPTDGDSEDFLKMAFTILLVYYRGQLLKEILRFSARVYYLP